MSTSGSDLKPAKFRIDDDAVNGRRADQAPGALVTAASHTAFGRVAARIGTQPSAADGVARLYQDQTARTRTHSPQGTGVEHHDRP